MTTTTLLAAGRRRLRPLADVHVRRAAAIVLLPLALALVGALASARSAAVATPTELPPIIIVATPTMTGPAIAVAQPPRAILARFDYRDPATAAALTESDVARVLGVAGDWRLIATVQGGQVWIAAADVPADTPADRPLVDLAPPPTPIVIYVPVPAQAPTASIDLSIVRFQTTAPARPPLVITSPGNAPIVVDRGQKRMSP
jgi:hypothetical protein